MEHPLRPGAPAAPHTREDEVSSVLAGRVGFLLGDDTVKAETGTYVAKPRGIAHTVWNAGAEPARILEVIAPAGFDR